MRVFAETAGGFSRAGVSGFPIPGPASDVDGGEARIGVHPGQSSLSLFLLSLTTLVGPSILSHVSGFPIPGPASDQDGGEARIGVYPNPYTLHPTPYILHPTPHTLHPMPAPELSLFRFSLTTLVRPGMFSLGS